MRADASTTNHENMAKVRAWRVQAEGDLVRGVSKTSEAVARRW